MRDVADWRLVRVVLVASAVSLPLGAPAVLSWSERVADPGLGALAYRTAFRWNRAMARVGLDAPYRAVRRAERRLEGLRFDRGTKVKVMALVVIQTHRPGA